MFDDMHGDAMNELIDHAAKKPGVSVVVLDMSRVQIIFSIGLGNARPALGRSTLPKHSPGASRHRLDETHVETA